MHHSRILKFHFNLLDKASAIKLPKGVQWLFPYELDETKSIMHTYYQQYYSDDRSRTLVFGINPGRFGSGLTGIPFTDPIRLHQICGLENSFAKKAELSAEFIHLLIREMGGLEVFNSKFYITSLCPLGFIKDDINFNYYDDKLLQSRVTSFIKYNIENQIKLVNGNLQTAYCLGEGKNFAFFQKLNETHKYFDKIISLPHPRWIMQYRRKKLNEYIEMYIEKLNQSSI